jgi:hypothetical protein
MEKEEMLIYDVQIILGENGEITFLAPTIWQ